MTTQAAITASTEREQIVLRYYTLVDSASYPEMYALFAEDILYRRCEHEIAGMAAFKAFYEQDRHIVGAHQITHLYAQGESVMTRGVFAGKNGAGEEIELHFADFFDFNAIGKISHRYTYLASGYQATT